MYYVDSGCLSIGSIALNLLIKSSSFVPVGSPKVQEIAFFLRFVPKNDYFPNLI